MVAMVYPTRILDLVDGKNLQIVTNFSGVLFNTHLKALRYYVNFLH